MLLRQRTSVPGTALHALVLAARRNDMIGIDLASGAFVRMIHPDPPKAAPAPASGGRTATARPRPKIFDVVAGRVSRSDERELPLEHPELVGLSAAPQVVGRMRGRQLDRYLKPVLHPRHVPLLGFWGPATPFWTLEHDRPSLALVAPEAPIAVRTGTAGVRCSFRWQGNVHEMPVDDPRLNARLDWFPENPLRGSALADLLGYRPSLVLLTLSAPVSGYCYKVASALLPR